MVKCQDHEVNIPFTWQCSIAAKRQKKKNTRTSDLVSIQHNTVWPTTQHSD